MSRLTRPALNVESDDVFERIEARFVALSGLLEELRRYRALEAEAEHLYRSSSRISASVRAALRARAAGQAEAALLEKALVCEIDRAEKAHDAYLAGPDYAALLAALHSGSNEVRRRVPETFAEIEPAEGIARLYHPLLAKRGEGVLEPETGVESIREIAQNGFAPTGGPGVGADRTVKPIRFYEDRPEGIDAAVLLVVEGSDVKVPAFRAPTLGEVLIYAERLCVPLRVALRTESPDDWLEARAGGYAEYRGRWRDALLQNGFTVVDL